MVDANVYFGDDFGQKIDLTVRIREILRNYPEGTSMFKEMVQNADDAGATEVNFCLDYRHHASTRLAYEKLGPFQGPALLVHNDATFTDADLQSIQRIGNSLKKDDSMGWKTGRFGVGFNSVYHLTDLPSFVSGRQLVFFDPQACHLPNVNPSNPGKMIDYIAHPDLASDFPDQVSPFRCFGCNFAEPFKGTIFRLSLRTEEQAQRSRLSNRAQKPAQTAELLEEFADTLHLVLLFLRNVSKISIWEWRSDEEFPIIVREALIDDMTSEVRLKRSFRHTSVAFPAQSTHRFPIKGIFHDYSLKIVARNCTKNTSKDYEYFIANQLGGGECSKIACNPSNADQHLIPWGGVAVLTTADSTVNGYFELSSNRRDIWYGEGLSGKGRLRAQWNIALLCDVIAPCYARAILHLANTKLMRPDQHVKLLPQTLPPAPWDSLSSAFFSLIRGKPCLYSEVGGGRWVCPAESMVFSSVNPDSKKIEQLMLDDGLPVVRNLTEDQERLLVKLTAILSYAGPQNVRDVYKAKFSSHAGNREATKYLLSFMLSDLEPARLNALVGVNFLPVADGTLRKFESRPRFDPASLEYLRSMGFSRQHANHALAVVGDAGVENTLDWLLRNPNPAVACGKDARTTFLIPNQEELVLLDKARGHLVRVEALTQSGMNLLSSDMAGDILNVQKLDYQGFEDMLAVILPAAWFGMSSVPWTGEDAPDEEWFRRLWAYIGKSKHLSAFKDKWPIVPTSSDTLVQLNLSAGVLSAECIPDGCLQCLQKLQVRVLLPNLFSSFQPNPSLWHHIHQPTAIGVLSCIEVAIGAGGVPTRVNELFENTNISDRKHLLCFLASSVTEEIGSGLKHICCNLPILPGLRDATGADKCDIRWTNGNDNFESMDSGVSLAFVSIAELKAQRLEPLLCEGIAPEYLHVNFIHVSEGDVLIASFLSHLGVRRISKVDFFAKYLIPRINYVKPEIRVKFVYKLLVELPMLLADDSEGVLLHIIETAAIFPTMTGGVKSIGDLYDPEIDEFIELMDGSFFPALELQTLQPLSALRSIGLQRALSRRSILSLAVSLEKDQTEILTACTDPEQVAALDEMREKLRIRSVNLLQYVDTHMDQLVTPTPLQMQVQTFASNRKKGKGISFLRNVLGNDRPRGINIPRDISVPTVEAVEKQEMERTEIGDFKAKLAIIAWIPVCEEKPHSAAPWYNQGHQVIVASPLHSRPRKHLWLCSSQCYIIKCSVHSEVLQNLLGWEKYPSIDTIATQLKEISHMFNNRRSRRDSFLESTNTSDEDTHVVRQAVYNIYQLLSTFFKTNQGEHRNLVLKILSENGAYVWVGNRFVSASNVATVSIINAEPYLCTVSNELLYFIPFLRAIGVRERFSLADYVHVLGAMRKESLAGVTIGEDNAKAAPLSADKLAMVIGLIQLISDLLQHHSDHEIFAPDRNGVLEFAANLTYDDAPWLDKCDYETSQRSIRFIHPKISNDVAAKIGSCSLRSELLSESRHEVMSFAGEGGVEAFGQTEVLTKRIAHILEQYPDGPNIISELIQNADDAGATRVCVLYNSCSYGTSSLLSPAMAKWQGPSLFCYNDAEFSDEDFINLARIGQASKLQRAATTGRFGLGFNSVYHFTDLPSIVSAKTVVMFDPHATHLPGISAANPGIKICFAKSSIVKQFPDQFAPYKDVFGCDLEQHYSGTLFRFPLRNSSLAASSEIMRRGYSHCEIVELFKGFQGSIIDSMIFLRSVRKVEIYLQSEIGQSPTLLYGAEVPEEDRGQTRLDINRFMQNDRVPENTVGVAGHTAKRDFYARLRSTAADKLPSATQVLRIRRWQRKELQTLFHRFSDVEGNVEIQTLDTSKEDQTDEVVERYLVCNQIGGGRAREMACAVENESLKLIPWVGIAGRIDGVATEGRAFCFLPLPVRVGLPVHVNGYFELSSNRRDIWTGDDMSGDGKLRSEWNSNLLVDAVSPAYLTFLLEAKATCEDHSQYFSFFPSKVPAYPWDGIALELFRIMKNRPMFYQSVTQGMGHALVELLPSVEVSEKSVAPSSSVLVDETLDDWEILEVALHAASLVTVHVPAALHSVLVQLHAVYGVMTPAFFRQLTKQENFLPNLDPSVLRQVVQFCLSDCKSSPRLCAEALDQQPIVPLKDGNFEKIRFNEKNVENSDSKLRSKRLCVTYCFESALEEQLLDGFPHRVVRGNFKELFDQLPFVYEHSNLSVVDLHAIADTFLPDVLGNCWSKIEEGMFTFQVSSHVEVIQNKKNWIRLLWEYVDAQLQTISQLPQAFTTLPLVPIMFDKGTRWVCLGANLSLVLPHFGAPVLSSQALHQLQRTLAKVGIYIIDTAYIIGKRSAQWLRTHKYAHRLTSTGLLAALGHYQSRHHGQHFDEIFSSTTSADRQALCDFLAQTTYDTVPADFQPVLFELPIFPVHGKLTSIAANAEQGDRMHFVSLRRGGYLPDTEADVRILNSSFFRAESEATRKFLRDCGVEELNYTAILLDHVFPHLSEFDRQDEDLVDSVIINALETLLFHQRNDTRFREFVSTRAIIPSRKRIFRAISQLHDPNVSELGELVGDNSLPAHAFSTSSTVEILRSLGLRTGLSCHAVLESAYSIEAMYREGNNDAVDRACLKARSLLTIVNRHFDSMMVNFSVGSDMMSDHTEHDEKEAMLTVVAALKAIQWLPILTDPPNHSMPWKGYTVNAGRRELLSKASDMRPLNDAWFCSSSLNVLDGELTSEELVTAFGWKGKVAPLVVAKQLEAIGALWEEYCFKKDSGTLPLSSTSPNWRFPLSEVHSMYEDLEDYRLSDEERWAVSPLYRKLANASWIWTGNGFAYPYQIAVMADASLEPLLYCCPSEHIVPRSLLASFGIKEAFVTVDYLEAIMRLPRHEVLSAKQVAACLKIYEIVSEDTTSLVSALDSFASQEMVLLDQTNQLIPTTQLTFDDMEWDESREVRRGVKFVANKVPRTVAHFLGATSLHSKLAQTSVASFDVTCPSAAALQNLLPPEPEWHQALLWETILVAEQLGGTQVDFSLDFRHHPSQRVIQPSLQPLQAEALCIHIHDVVLSEHDVNNLFCKESPHAGLLCGFVASDCVQILSGEGFYILDPTGCYLSSSVGPTSASTSASSQATSIGRRYEVLSADFVRYPDQLLPFTSLPYCPGNISRGTRSTLIRFPWRKTGSAVSSYVLDSMKAEELISFIKSQLYQTLIFTETVHRLSLWSLGTVSEFASQCHGEVSLDAPERTLQQRNMTRKNKEWKKKFSLQSFFKSAVIPENQMEFVVNLEMENKRYRDIWLFASNNGFGRSRDLACTPTHEMLGSTPYVGVASHIFRDGNPAPHLCGHVYDIINTGQQVGLPVHINGCFKRTTVYKNLALALSTNQDGRRDPRGISGSEEQVAAGWNRVLLEDGVSDAYVKLLLIAKRRYAPNSPRALYNIWPVLQKVQVYRVTRLSTDVLTSGLFAQRRGAGELGTIVQTHTYYSIAARELFFCTDGIFRSLKSGYHLDPSGMNIQVTSFAQLHFPAFDVPTKILQDCLHLFPSRVSVVTPKVMRQFLKSVSSSKVLSDVCLSLLEYCLRDVPFPLPCETDPIWTEFHGLSLLPLEDGSIGVLRVNQRRTNYVLASFNQVELLRPLGHIFVSLAASRRLHKFFSETRFASIFGLASFSIKILSDYIERILPPFWKNQTVVDWDPKSPIEIGHLWLYRFWQEVHLERRSLGYFVNWPLIPIKGSRLISCSKVDMVVCVWADSADREISAEVAKTFMDSALQQENRMAIIDAEHRRFMELSAAKIEREDEFANGSIFDETESIADDGENGDDEVEDPGAMVSISDESLPSGESCFNQENLQEDQEADEVVSLSPELTSLVLEDASFDNVEGAELVEASFSNVEGSEVGEASFDNVEGAEVGEGYAVFVYPVEDESQESCSRETLHNVLLDLNVATVELAYFNGQEHDIVPRSADVGRIVLDGIFASIWGDLRWERLGEARAVLLADFFRHHGNAYGGYNRVQVEMLKQLPIFVNIRNELCALRSESHYFLIPLELDLTDIPLPPDAQQCFLRSNPTLNAFYQELGVEEMSDSRLLIYVLPMYGELPEVRRNQILQIILRKWQSLRHNTELISLLSVSALFSDGESTDGSCYTASSFCDPRNSVLTTIFDGVCGRFPAQRYRTPEWLDLMSEIGLQTEVTADIFVECAERIDERCAGKQALSAEDEKLTTALHQFFVQNYDKFDRSRIFFERIISLAFVPAILYEAPDVLESTSSARVSSGSYTPRCVVRKYSECAIPDDQALVYTTMPILASVALPARVLFSRLCIQSPPPQDQVIAHLLSITNSNCASSSGSLNWQFFMPMEKVFQAIFQYLQENWDEIDAKTRKCLAAAAVIPVGSTLVKGSRLFFHLGENLAPLLYEVPRMFGAYDALFCRMGSKVSPTVDDYICLLSDLNLECCGHPLNLNELIAAARSVDLLVTAMADSNHRLSTDEKKSIFLPSGNAVMRPMLAMAYNDSSALCSSIDITQLPLVHPRISTRCCNILGVPGATTVVTEELDGSENLVEMLVSDDIAHFTSVLASQPFADGLRTIITTQQQKAPLYDAFGFAPDFEDLDRRILSLAKYEVKCVTELRSHFVAKLDCPPRRIDVTKVSRVGNLSFLDQTSGQIYIAKRVLEGRCDTGLRASYLVARCINQMLGGILQDCSVLESILTCDEDKIPVVLQRLDVYEDPVLIEEKLRGVLGQPLCETDCANVELAPLRSCLPGELVAVEGMDGSLRYSKILREGPSDIAGVSQYEVKVDSSATRQVLATDVYFFRSARVRTGSRFDAVVSEPSPEQAKDLSTSHCENAILPSSVVTIVSGAGSSEITSDVNIPAPAVSPANILSAVNDLLSRLNVTLDVSVQDLMAENLQMQCRLDVAENSRRAAATQIDIVTREKKELLDALVCAVCLENQVNRVLIPCGHIYCGSCVEQLPRPSCPICRQDIFSSSVFHVPS